MKIMVTKTVITRTVLNGFIPHHHRYHENVLYTRYDSSFTIGLHRFHFLFHDGMARVTTPVDTFRVEDIADIATPGHCRPVVVLSASPNPFTARVRLQAPSGTRGLQVLNSTGRVVRTFEDDPGGRFEWDGTDETGNGLAPGVYFCRSPDRPDRRLRLVRLRR